MRRREAATALFLFVLAATSVRGQEDLQIVVSRAIAFVETFQREFGMLVSEEHYDQDVRAVSSTFFLRGRGAPNPATPVRTVLRSDFLLVRTTEGVWMPFRDVFERNGRAVRDREDRLSKLFLENSHNGLEQARKIMEESARYNVGNISRNINLPTLALDFLTDTYRSRFEFTDGGRDDIGRILIFKEVGRPTYVVTTGQRDLPVTGRFWVDEATGRIEQTQLDALDTAVQAHITVRYQSDLASGTWVPARMEERYVRRGDPAEVRGLATYSNFRRFQVQTTEEVAR